MVMRWLGSLWLAVLVLAASCGGDGSEEVAAPPVSPVGRLTPVLQRTPEATPIITDGLFEAPTKGYSVRIPEGWTARPDFLPTPTSTTDVFFGPEDEGPVHSNIGVTCERVEEDVELERYVSEKRELLALVLGRTPEVAKGEVSGREAAVFDYSLERAPAVDKVEVVFAGENCIWNVALTVPSGQMETHRPVFEEFLASFQLLP